MKKILFLMLLFCLKPTLSFAESCTSLPDCEKLGYYLGYNAACGTDDSRYIFCPYDVRYRKCVNYDCANMGFTADDKSAWCRNIVTCKFDEAYTLCADSYEIGATCTPVECTAVTIPSENAHGTVKCQPKAADCSTGEPVYTAWACDIGFHEQNGACVANCPIVNCPAGITPPENATCTSKCSSVSSSCVTGQEVCLSYSCNSGFHAEGGLCLPDPVCTPITCAAVERPAHSHGTTQCIPTASDCSTQAPVYTDWACDTNYHKDGNTCQKDCSIKTCTAVTVPENGRCKTTCKSQNASCVEGSEVCGNVYRTSTNKETLANKIVHLTLALRSAFLPMHTAQHNVSLTIQTVRRANRCLPIGNATAVSTRKAVCANKIVRFKLVHKLLLLRTQLVPRFANRKTLIAIKVDRFALHGNAMKAITKTAILAL